MTTTRFKDFGSEGVIRAEEYEPIGFALAGHSFTCHPAIPGSVLLNFVANADGAQAAKTAGSIMEFFASSMDPSEFERFQAVINDPKIIIPAETLSEVVSWLIEQYSERPTKRQSPSEPGPLPTGPTSEAPVSAEVAPQPLQSV